MFTYKGCKGKRVFTDYLNCFIWEITYEDGSKEQSMFLAIALMLCRKELKRAPYAY